MANKDALRNDVHVIVDDRLCSPSNANLPRSSHQLYVDPARSVMWGDCTAGTMHVGGQADSLGMAHTVYGRIPPQQSATPGIYADSLLITKKTC